MALPDASPGLRAPQNAESGGGFCAPRPSLGALGLLGHSPGRPARQLCPRTTRRGTDRTAVTVWLTPRALAALDDTAGRWALTRSALAGELIDLQTAGDAGQ